MRKFLLGLVLLVSGFISAQSYTCDDLLEDIKYKGYFQGYESTYSSTAIKKLQWYEYEGRYFALIQFKNGYRSKVYVYGNWSSTNFYKIRRGFRNYKRESGSAGKAFWAWIQPNSSVGCETSKSYLY